MIVLTEQRGTEEWRAAHACRITASDAGAFMAATGTKKREALVNRLVLDFESVGDHRVEQPEPWQERHEVELRAALAAYVREVGPAEPCGMLGSSVMSWLVCSPHGLTKNWVLLLRPRQTLKAYHEKLGELSRADRARAAILSWITERQCGVVDYLDGLGRVDDQLYLTHVPLDEEWLYSQVVPKLVGVWSDVQRRLGARQHPFIRRA